MAVRVPLADEGEWFDGLLAGHHYLGAGQPVGDYLRQVVERDGNPGMGASKSVTCTPFPSNPSPPTFPSPAP
jgi:hypothetical protein